MFKLITILLAIGTLCLLVRKFVFHLQYERKRSSRGLPPMRHYPGKDKLLGLDYVWAMLQAIKADRFLEFQTNTFAGSKAWSANFLGNRMVYTTTSENMKALSTSHQHCFAIEPIRVGNGAITPFTGRGVSSSDGLKWQSSRNLVMPYFDRGYFTNLRRLASHVDRLLENIPKDGSTIDMQPLFQRWFLDTSTEFLFGETVNSLDNPEREWPRRDMLTVQAGLRLRLQLSSFVFLHHDKKWLAACKRIQNWLDGYIVKVYKQLDEERLGKPHTDVHGTPRTDLLWTLARQVQDRVELRTQLTAVWIPSNETTSILMSNTLYALARHPHVVQRLRQEVTDYGDKPVTFEGLRSLSYLRWTINESHRLYPVSLQTVRYCIQDTALPTGGGSDGKLPIFISKGDIVHCNRYLMHRDPDIWGADANEFRPERWEESRPMWNFVPFGGGPRICPAHVMVDTECAYTLFRILQRFKEIVVKDEQLYTGVMRVGLSNKHGCKIALLLA